VTIKSYYHGYTCITLQINMKITRKQHVESHPQLGGCRGFKQLKVGRIETK